MVRRAFSIIELLVCLGVVAVLVTLVAVGVPRVRHDAWVRATMSNLRQCNVAVMSYSGDWRDSFPLLIAPDSTDGVMVLPGGERLETPGYFAASMLWYRGLADGYFAGVSRHAVTRPPDRFGGPAATFEMTCTVLADPAFWDRSTRTGEAQYRGTRTAEVLFPAQKSVLSSIEEMLAPGAKTALPAGTGVMMLSMVDGGVHRARAGEFLGGVESGEGRNRGSVHWLDWGAGGHTMKGVHGRDRR